MCICGCILERVGVIRLSCVIGIIWLQNACKKSQNDEEYIELQEEKKIPESQYRKIKNDYETIKAEFQVYLKGYLKVAKKGRVEKEPLYRESSLINFDRELGC